MFTVYVCMYTFSVYKNKKSVTLTSYIKNKGKKKKNEITKIVISWGHVGFLLLLLLFLYKEKIFAHHRFFFFKPNIYEQINKN